MDINNVIKALQDAKVFQEHWNESDAKTKFDFDFDEAISQAKEIKIHLLEHKVEELTEKLEPKSQYN